MALSPQKLFNRQGVQKISGFKSECHEIRFGTLNVGNLYKRKTEVCEELRKRRVDVCCMQKVRWKGQGARLVGTLIEGINCGGQEMVQDFEGLEFW